MTSRAAVYGPELHIPSVAAAFVTRRSLSTRRPEALLQFMRAIAEAIRIVHTDKESTYKILGKRLRISDRKVLETAYQTNIGSFETRLTIAAEAVQAILEETETKQVQAQELIDRPRSETAGREGLQRKLFQLVNNAPRFPPDANVSSTRSAFRLPPVIGNSLSDIPNIGRPFLLDLVNPGVVLGIAIANLTNYRLREANVRQERSMQIMNGPLLLIIVIVATGLLFVVAPVVADIYARYRNGKVLNCPETPGTAEVMLNTHGAALAAAFGKPLLRVKSCSLWPEKRGCAEKCINENWPIP